MKIETRIFGSVEIDDSKIIKFDGGIVGFPDMTRFALIHDHEREKDSVHIRWLQSFEESNFAMPVIDPLSVVDEYNPKVDDALFEELGVADGEDLLVLVTITIPSDLTKMSVNLRAPILINPSNGHAAQVILDSDDYEIKYKIYETLRKRARGE